MISKFKDIFTLHSLKISYLNSICTKNSYLYVGCRTYTAPCTNHSVLRSWLVWLYCKRYLSFVETNCICNVNKILYKKYNHLAKFAWTKLVRLTCFDM